jgi:hypothetical protein
VAAIRAATGRPLTRVPVRPEHIVGVPAPESADRPPASAGRTGPPEEAAGGAGVTSRDPDGGPRDPAAVHRDPDPEGG